MRDLRCEMYMERNPSSSGTFATVSFREVITEYRTFLPQDAGFSCRQHMRLSAVQIISLIAALRSWVGGVRNGRSIIAQTITGCGYARRSCQRACNPAFRAEGAHLPPAADGRYSRARLRMPSLDFATRAGACVSMIGAVCR